MTYCRPGGNVISQVIHGPGNAFVSPIGVAFRQPEHFLDDLRGLRFAAERINEAALERYRKCQYTGVWPTGYEDIRLIDSL